MSHCHVGVGAHGCSSKLSDAESTRIRIPTCYFFYYAPWWKKIPVVVHYMNYAADFPFKLMGRKINYVSKSILWTHLYPSHTSGRSVCRSPCNGKGSCRPIYCLLRTFSTQWSDVANDAPNNWIRQQDIVCSQGNDPTTRTIYQLIWRNEQQRRATTSAHADWTRTKKHTISFYWGQNQKFFNNITLMYDQH